MSVKVKTERQFLHDIAGVLGTAMLLVGSIAEDSRVPHNIGSDDLIRLFQVSQSLEKMRALLQERRSYLISTSEQTPAT